MWAATPRLTVPSAVPLLGPDVGALQLGFEHRNLTRFARGVLGALRTIVSGSRHGVTFLLCSFFGLLMAQMRQSIPIAPRAFATQL